MEKRLKLFGNSLVDLGVDTIKFLDPTGVTSWKDAYKAIKKASRTKDRADITDAAIETLGALPIIGKIGKLGKVGKFINKINKVVSKTPAKYLKLPGGIVRKTIPTNKGRKVLDNARHVIKGSAVASDLDDVVLGGQIKKKVAYNIGVNSGGVASSLAPIVEFIGIKIPYSGYAKANDQDRRKALTYPDVLEHTIFGTGKFEKYNKPIKFNGKELTNTYKGILYPADTIIANRKLRGTMQQANSENFYKTDIDKVILDTHKFRMSFKPNYVRSSDTWDFDNQISGNLMNKAAKPTWRYPNAGIMTFVQETPVKYTDISDSILNRALQ